MVLVFQSLGNFYYCRMRVVRQSYLVLCLPCVVQHVQFYFLLNLLLIHLYVLSIYYLFIYLFIVNLFMNCTIVTVNILNCIYRFSRRHRLVNCRLRVVKHVRGLRPTRFPGMNECMCEKWVNGCGCMCVCVVPVDASPRRGVD